MSTTRVGEQRSWQAKRKPLALVLALVAAGVLVGLVGVPAQAAGTKGNANMTYWPSSPWRIVYGQDLPIEGYVQDESASCLGITHDCDNPAGYVGLMDNTDNITLAAGDLSPSPDTDNYSTFAMTMRGKQLAPGHYDVSIAYAGDFDAFSFDSTLDVVKNPCTMAVTQSTPSSQPGEAVTFTGALTGSTFAHPGATITFTDGGGGFLSSGTVDANDRVSFSTAGLPQGDTTVVASYAGTAVDEACAGSALHHVATDPPPVAVDDSYSTQVGVPITVHPMENDFDPGGGAIRAEYLSAPDAGDVEAVDNATLVFTPPPDYVGETSMRYVVYDSIGQSSNEAIIHFSFGCTPEANADGYDVTYGAPLVVGAPGVMGNDVTCDLPTEVTSQPTHGTLVYEPQTGAFTYTPNNAYIGPDSFTYQYSQGLESPVSARVDLFVHTPPPTTTTTTTSSSTSTSSSSTSPTSTSTSTIPSSTSTTSTSTSSTSTSTSTIPSSTSTTSTTPSSTSTSSTSTSTTPSSTSTSSTSTSTTPSSTSTTSTSTSTTPSSTTPPSSTSTTSSTNPPTGAPTITSVDPSHGPRGARITVSGSGFVPGGTTVTVGGATVPADVKVLSAPLAAAGTVDGQVLEFTVAMEAAAGTSDLTITTDAGSAVASAAFTVDAVSTSTSSTTNANPTTTRAASVTTTANPVSVSPSSSTVGTLPSTGTNSRGPLLVGLALVLGGVVALLVRRRLRC